MTPTIERMAAQTAQNLVEAGHLDPANAENCEEFIRTRMTWEEAAVTLLEAHNMREEAIKAGTRIVWTPMSDICPN